MSQQNPGRPAGATAFVLSLYFVIACIWAWPATARTDRRVHDLGDPLHLGYIMAWDAHQIVRQPWALFDANSFYPYSRSLTFADHLLPEALLVAPINWSTGNAVLAFNAAVILALTASAFCMYSLMLVVTRSRAAAMLAGLVYAFNGFMLQETPRVHVLNIQWWPLALLFLMKFVERASVRSGCLAIGLLFIQALSGSYYLIYTALFAPCWLIALYVFMRRAPDRRALAILAGAGVLAAALGILILHPYLATLKTLTIEKGWAGGADLLSFFDPGPRNWLYGGARPAIQAAEVPHFIGIAALILAIWGALVTIRASAERRALAVVALGTIVFSAAMTLGPLVHLGGRLLGGGPYDWLYWNVPLVRGMASPERIGILIKLGLAILVGFGAERLLSRLQTIQRTAMMILLILLLPLEHWSPARRIAGVDVPTGSLVPQVYRDLAQSGSTPVVDLPLYPERAKKLWALYLYFSTYHWRPIPIGRTSFYPPAHDFLAWSLGDFPSATSLRLLDQMGVRTVVVHPNIWPLCERNERLRQIEGTPALKLLRQYTETLPASYGELGLGEERLYEIQSSIGVNEPALCVPDGEIARAGWQFASNGANKPERSVDGQRNTAWMTHHPQKPGDFIEIHMQGPEDLSALAMELSYPYDEFPRRLQVMTRASDSEPWRRVEYADGPRERGETLAALLDRPKQARWILRVPKQTVSQVRLSLSFKEADPAWPRWSLPEIRLYRECR